MTGRERSGRHTERARHDGGGVVLKRIWSWIDDRLGLSATVKPIAEHPTPRTGWDYVLGSAALVAFTVQVITGVALAFSYVPAPISAYESLTFITNTAVLGRVVR